MFASWSYDGSKLLLEPAIGTSNSLQFYIENTEWALLDFKYKSNLKYYECCDQPFPDIVYYFSIARNPSYYILSLIIPSAFITVVTIVGFFIPQSSTGENTEKVSLGVTALLSLAIILLMVADKMPATSKVTPLMGKQDCLTLSQNCITKGSSNQLEPSRPVPPGQVVIYSHFSKFGLS